MKMKSTFLLMMVFFPHAVLANAKVVGNGGNAVVCKNRSGKITSAESFDLYEGRILKNLSYKESSISPLKQAIDLANKISDAIGTTNSAENFASEVEDTFKTFRFLPAGAGLKPIDDGAEVIVPKDCMKVQTANRQDWKTTLIDSDVWEAMSNTQKGALILHEAIYRYLQKSLVASLPVEKDSSRARRLVAYLFSGGSLESIFSTKKYAIGKTFFCSTNREDLPDLTTTHFTVYQETSQAVTVQFEQWLSHKVLTRTIVKNYLPANLGWPIDSNQEITISGELISPAENQIESVVKFTSPGAGNIWFLKAGVPTPAEMFECVER